MDGKESPAARGADGCREEDFRDRLRCAFAALFLPGSTWTNLAQRRSSWPRVLAALQRSPDGDCCQVLRDAGLWGEASLLADPGLRAWGIQVASLALTASDEDYPSGWRTRLGAAATPCLWRDGDLPPAGAPWVGVVGSRNPAEWAVAAAIHHGRAAASFGAVLVSGGAQGVDTIAARAAHSMGGHVVQIVPCGLRVHPGSGLPAGPRVLNLSPAAPGAPFSAALAKERNALIYAASIATIVVQPRRGEGGTWCGAVDAIRRRLTCVCAVAAPGESAENEAVSALRALGAQSAPSPQSDWMGSVSELALSWRDGGQPSLFGVGHVRELRVAYSV